MRRNTLQHEAADLRLRFELNELLAPPIIFRASFRALPQGKRNNRSLGSPTTKWYGTGGAMPGPCRETPPRRTTQTADANWPGAASARSTPSGAIARGPP